MQSSCHKKVQGCFLCSSQPCCPEHCCNWDTCKCGDCQMCQQIKHVQQEAIIPDQEYQKFNLRLSETGSYMPEHQFQQTPDSPNTQNLSYMSPKMKRILHSGLMKKKSIIQNEQIQQQNKLNRSTELQFAKSYNSLQPQLQENQSRSFALEAAKKLQKKNPRLFKQNQFGKTIINKSIKQQYFSSKYEQIKLNASISLKKQTVQDDRKSEDSIVSGVRGLRNLKNIRLDDSEGDKMPKKYHPLPPPFPYAQPNRLALVSSNKLCPTINQDGSKIFKRKIIIKKSQLKM